MSASRLILVDLSALLTSNNPLIHRAELFKGRIVRSTPYHGLTPVALPRGVLCTPDMGGLSREVTPQGCRESRTFTP